MSLVMWTGAALVAAVAVWVLWGGSKQTSDGLAVTGVLHVNVNCSDFDRSREFYEALDKAVRGLIADAEARAVGNKRKTLKPVDL